MCVLKRTRKSPEEVAQWFRANIPRPFNAPHETYSGYPGMTITERDGRRQLRIMNWGFPVRAGAEKPKAVNQAADLSRQTWSAIAPAPAHRCLIPITEFAEPYGPRRGNKRAWFSVVDQPIAAWGGFWRSSAEWDDVYAGVTTIANAAVLPVQDRMPVLLMPEDYDRWMHGTIGDVLALQAREFPSELIQVEYTDEPWTERATPDDRQMSLGL